MTILKKEAVSLTDILAKALEIKGRCKDIRLESLANATVSHTEDFGRLHFIAPFAEDRGTTLGLMTQAELSAWAFKQLCSARLKVPYRYMKACIDSETPEIQRLFELNMNTHLAQYNNGVLLRLYCAGAGEPLSIRGVLTPSYTVFDSDRVMDITREMLNDDYVVRGHHIDEAGMQIRVTTPEPLKISGEDIFPGLIITSGDVGNRQLTVQFLLWKQVCSNGMVLAKLMGMMLKKRHYGAYDNNNFRESFVSTLDMFPSFVRHASELIEANRAKALTDEDLTKRLEAFSKQCKLKNEERDEIVHLTKNVYGMSVWGYLNALTEFAQAERFDIDDRTEIETYAGNILAASKIAA